MTSSRFDPGLTSVRPQKPWTSPFYGSMNGPGLKTLLKIELMVMLNYENYCPYIWARWLIEIMKIEQLFFIVFIVKILVWKPNSFLVFLFILITLVGLNNTHFLNYTKNVIKILCIPNTRKCSQAHFQGLYQKSDNETVFHKMLFEKWHIFKKSLMLKQTKCKYSE